MEYITQATDKLPAIVWDDLEVELLESDSEERMEVYICRGFCDRGIQYNGIATFFCGEIDSVKHIELQDVFG